MAAFGAGMAASWLMMPVAAGAAGLPRAGLDLATLRSQQEAVIRLDHQLPIGEAQYAVDQLSAAVSNDRSALAGAEGNRDRAARQQDQATNLLAADTAALAATAATEAADLRSLAADRAALRSIAVGLYTGEITDPQPTSLHALESEQKKIIVAAEIEAVTGVVDGNFVRDLAAARADQRRRDRRAEQVASDRSRAEGASQQEAEAVAADAAAQAALVTDQDRLEGAQARLVAARRALDADLAAVAGHAPSPGGLSLMGGAALDTAQLVVWYRNQGYVDLTSTPIARLAAWYLQAGASEGIRGDVAFAQAVLETGGFSSPDSVTLNNYAGIGHCDSCPSGWQFPSPEGGVLGQTQLLRIFADGLLPAGGPGPVLPALTPGRQGRRACCPTWESLTGVWASDPNYGSHILGIYQQMLGLALTRPA